MCSGTSSVANVSLLSYSVLGALREACQSPVRTEAGAFEILVPEERHRLRSKLRTEMLEVSVVYVYTLVPIWFLIQLSESVSW